MGRAVRRRSVPSRAAIAAASAATVMAVVVATSSGAAALQAPALDGHWVAARGAVFGTPIAPAALPHIRITFDDDSASWTVPGFPQRFAYRASGDSLDLIMPAAGDARWVVPARVWPRGDSLEISLLLADPFAPNGAPPSRPDARGPAKIRGHVYLVLSRAAGPAPAPDADMTTAAHVAADSIRRRTEALLEPAMAGRGSGQPGGERAARLIARWFEEAGLEPLGEDGYMQRIPLVLARTAPSATLHVDSVTFQAYQDFALASLAMRTRPEMSDSVAGELALFASDIGFAPDSVPVPRIDVEGKVVGWVLPASVPGMDVFRTYEALHRSGAAAVLLLMAAPLPPVMLQSPLFGVVAALDTDLYGEQPAPPVITLGPGPFAALFGDASALRSFADRPPSAAPLEATGRRVSIAYELLDMASAPAHNVVGVLRGSDPVLRDEAVILTAHYDALGQSGDVVYPGAADNALGTAEIVEIARAIGASGTRPRRSIVFLAAGAEERGVLGTLHWVRNPTWPLEDIVADINLDGGDPEAFGPLHGVIDLTPRTPLSEVAAEVSASFGLPLVPDNEPASGSSDFYDFLRAGIPAIQLMGLGGDPALSLQRMRRFGGLAHQPGDVIGEEWDWRGPQQMARIYLQLALRIANADSVARISAEAR